MMNEGNRRLRNRSGHLKQDRSVAVNFATTLRGQYILSKALKEAIEVMGQREGKEREPSDLADMRYLYEHVYSICHQTEIAVQMMKDQHDKLP